MLRPFVVLAACAAVLPSAAIFADDASRPGDQTVSEVCSVCHGAGLLGAPQIGNGAAWSARLRAAGSIDGLLASATNGKNNMPPRGGESDLSDADLRAAIQYMLAQSGVR